MAEIGKGPSMNIRMQRIFCPECGWRGMIGRLKPCLDFVAASKCPPLGDRCPRCGTKLLCHLNVPKPFR